MSQPILPGGTFDQRQYQTGIILQSLLATSLSTFNGEEKSNSAFWELNSSDSKRGSTFRRVFQKFDRDAPPKATGTIGNESSSTDYYQDVASDYLFEDGGIANLPAEQGRVSFDLLAPEHTRMAQKWGYQRERSVINQLAGNTLVNDLSTYPNYGFSGCNIVTAQDADHTYWVQGGNTNTTDANVAADTGATLDGTVLEDLKTRMTSTEYQSEPIPPCDTPFGELHVLVVSKVGLQQIQKNVTGNDIFTIHQAMIQGGMDLMDTPIGNAEGFIYRGFLVISSNFMPRGITSSAAQANTRVAVAFGANAGAWLFAEGWAGTDNHIGYTEYRAHRQLSMRADSVSGFLRTIVDGKSWASFRVVHYSAV